MSYLKALSNYRSLADKITEDALTGATRRGGLGRRSFKVPEETAKTNLYSFIQGLTSDSTFEEENPTEYLAIEEHTEEAPKESKKPKSKPVPVGNADEREILAKTIQAEAGNQDYKGKLAVAEVIANRVQSGRWGDSLTEVIMAPGQFSAWNSVTGYAGGEQGQNMDRIRPSKAAYKAADEILSGKYKQQTDGALNYYAVIPGVSPKPKWANDSFVKIGDHYFGRAS